jgi:hypothetical protein
MVLCMQILNKCDSRVAGVMRLSSMADNTESAAGSSFQAELTQAIATWNETPVPVLELQAIYTDALLVALGKYITYRKEKGELETCSDSSGILSHLTKTAEASIPDELQ